jgi:purine-binding chemotaxis protein CheW
MSEEIKSQEISTKEKTEETQRFLAFTLAQEQYAIPLLRVKEVIAMTEATPVPYTPPHFKGIINLRGQVISVIDLRAKLKMAKSEGQPETSIIILDLAPLCLGAVVDSIDSVLALEPEEISPTPDIETTVQGQFLNGVARKDKKLILLLDIESILSVEDLKAIKNQNKKTA